MPELTVKACAPYLDEENCQKKKKPSQNLAENELHIKCMTSCLSNNCKEY